MFDDIINAKKNISRRIGKLDFCYEDSEFLTDIFQSLEFEELCFRHNNGHMFVTYIGFSPYFEKLNDDEDIPTYMVVGFDDANGGSQFRVERVKNE